MKRDYPENGMLKTNGIVYFPPVKSFEEAFKIQQECGGVIISLEEDGFLVDEANKIMKLYGLKVDDLELYFRDVLKNNSIEDIDKIINDWKEEDGIL